MIGTEERRTFMLAVFVFSAVHSHHHCRHGIRFQGTYNILRRAGEGSNGSDEGGEDSELHRVVGL